MNVKELLEKLGQQANTEKDQIILNLFTALVGEVGIKDDDKAERAGREAGPTPHDRNKGR